MTVLHKVPEHWDHTPVVDATQNAKDVLVQINQMDMFNIWEAEQHNKTLPAGMPRITPAPPPTIASVIPDQGRADHQTSHEDVPDID